MCVCVCVCVCVFVYVRECVRKHTCACLCMWERERERAHVDLWTFVVTIFVNFHQSCPWQKYCCEQQYPHLYAYLWPKHAITTKVFHFFFFFFFWFCFKYRCLALRLADHSYKIVTSCGTRVFVNDCQQTARGKKFNEHTYVVACTHTWT